MPAFNLDQLMSVLRWMLSVGGPVSSLLIARGIPQDKVTAFDTALLTILGGLPPVISFVWGVFAHTDTAKLKAVEAMPEVTKIEVKIPFDATAADAPVIAVADPSRPKVVSQ